MLGLVVRQSGARDIASKESITARNKSESGVESLETDQAIYVQTLDPGSRRDAVRVRPKSEVLPEYMLTPGC
jgi:hypothetical protein